MIEVLGGFPDQVAAYVCHGHMTKDDYESLLMPDVADRLKRHMKIRAYIQMGDDFAGVEPGALWDDTKFGLAQMLDWERIALVIQRGNTDPHLTGMTNGFQVSRMPGPVDE